jgi:hypothetical protein
MREQSVRYLRHKRGIVNMVVVMVVSHAILSIPSRRQSGGCIEDREGILRQASMRGCDPAHNPTMSVSA